MVFQPQLRPPGNAPATEKGESRFGWGYVPTADLNVLAKKRYADMTKEEQNCWDRSRCLRKVTEGDWVVHINIPSYGQCTAAKVVGPYKFGIDAAIKDFGHCFPIDLSTKIVFDRRNSNIPSCVNIRPRRSFQRIYSVDEFMQAIENIKAGKNNVKPGETRNGVFLKNDLQPQLRQISELIHKHYKSKELEDFVKRILEKVEGVTQVINNGSGFRSDNGADLLVKYKVGLPIADFRQEETLVVQVKSYAGAMGDETPINQIRVAIDKYDPDTAMIVSTAPPTPSFVAALEKAKEETGYDIALIAGDDLAKFALQYGTDLLFELK